MHFFFPWITNLRKLYTMWSYSFWSDKNILLEILKKVLTKLIWIALTHKLNWLIASEMDSILLVASWDGKNCNMSRQRKEWRDKRWDKAKRVHARSLGGTYGLEKIDSTQDWTLWADMLTIATWHELLRAGRRRITRITQLDTFT